MTYDAGMRDGIEMTRTALRTHLDNAPATPDYFAAEAFDETLNTSWGALPLGAYLDGDLRDPEPTVGLLPDGSALLYEEAVNGIAGEPSGGKSWTAMVACVQEMQAGRTVVYVDLEDSPRRIIHRLLTAGATREQIRQHLLYVRPAEAFDLEARTAIDGMVRTHRPRLFVIDSTGEALALQGTKPNADDEVAHWFRLLPHHVAAQGPAVLLLDHVAKSSEGGRWPIGSQRKLAAITGAQYTQNSVEPFSRDASGHSSLLVSKDRHGFRAVGACAGHLDVYVDASGSLFSLLDANDRPMERADAGPKGESQRDRVLIALNNADGPLTVEEVAAASGVHRSSASTVLNALARDGLAVHDSGKPKRWSRRT